MHILSNTLIALVALVHIWFLILEMFLWTKPLGLKVFNQSKEVATSSAVLAANQGLYNGFLAAGLIIGLLVPDGAVAYTFKIFFLGCVIIAGLFGGFTVSKKIILVQAVPALLALITVLFV